MKFALATGTSFSLRMTRSDKAMQHAIDYAGLYTATIVNELGEIVCSAQGTEFERLQSIGEFLVEMGNDAKSVDPIENYLDGEDQAYHERNHP